MALAITNRGLGTNNTAGLSFTLSPTSNFAAGSTAVLCIAADNNSAGGATNNIDSVTDSLGNTWTKRQGPVFDNGAAAAGVQGAIFDTEMDGGTITTGTVITVNIGTSTTAKTWTLTQIAPAAGNVARFRAGANKSAGATGTAMTLGASPSVNVGEVLVAAIFMESGTTQTASTPDADATNGTWSANQYAEIGSTTSGSCIISQCKLQTTAASTQTYDVTVGISADYHGSYAIYQEIIPPQNITPTSGVATALGATPTVTLGGISVTPTAAIATAIGTAPAIALGGITVTPTAGVASALAADPTVDNEASGQNITPTSAVATAAAATPTVQLGGISVTATAAVATALAAAPTITRGAITVTPTAGAAIAQAATPSSTFGAIAATPTPAVATSSAASPTIVFGSINVTPTAAIASALATAPSIALGAIGATPVPAIANALAAAPIVALGGIVVTPTAGVASALAADATASNGIVVTPTPGIATAGAAAPTVTNEAAAPEQDPNGATASVVSEPRASASISAAPTHATASIVSENYPTATVIEEP